MKTSGAQHRNFVGYPNSPTRGAMTSAELAASEARNGRCLNQKIKDGYETRDIGLDPSRPASKRSPFYALEQNILASPWKSAGDLGKYDLVQNSCASHVCDVLKAGGADVPGQQGTAQLRSLVGIPGGEQ